MYKALTFSLLLIATVATPFYINGATLPIAPELQTLSVDSPPIVMKMRFSTEKKGKVVDKDSGTYTMVMTQGKYAIILDTENGPITTILDANAKKITSITSDKEGNLIAMIMPQISIGKQVIPIYDGVITKTDETRTILGYDCRKYVMTDDGDITEAWLANIPSVNWSQFAEDMTGMNKAQMRNMMPVIPDMPNAFMLESHTTSKGGKKVVHSYIESLDIGSNADLSLLEVPAGATVTDMSSLFGG